MTYTCANCDHTFESDDPKPRCPKCLRRHGLLTEGEAASPDAPAPEKATEALPASRRWLLLGALAVLLLGGVGLGVYFLTRSKPRDPVPSKVGLGPVDPGLLKKIAGKQGVPLGSITFAPDDALRAAGRRLGGADLRVVAQRVLDAVRVGLAQGETGKTAAGKKPWVDLRPAGRMKAGALLGAGPLFAMLQGEQPVTVVGYELACVTLALARAAGLHAVLAEIFQHTDLKGPADPSGFLGHFGVALYASNTFSGQPALVLDPARGTLGTAKEYEVLTDLRAAAHGLSLHAFGLLRSSGDLAAAAEAAGSAVKLGPRSATLLAARGMLLLTTGGVDPAQDSFRMALAVREDGPRHLLAALGMAQKSKSSAEALASLDQALNSDPDYALGHAFKAQFLLQQGKAAEAQAALDRAQELAPDLPEALVLRSQLLHAEGKTTQALALLRRAVERDPQSHEARLALWQILTMTGDEEAAKAEEKALLALVPTSQRGQTREMLQGFKKRFQEYKASQTPTPGTPMPGTPTLGGGDPYKLQPPSGSEPPGFGQPATPFDAPGSNDPMLKF